MELRALLLLAGMLALVLAGARLGFGRRRLPLGLQLLFETGAVFVLFGWLLGPQGMNLLSAAWLGQLGPVFYIGLGWIGFLYGSHFEWRRMRRFRALRYGAAFGESLLSFALVAAAAWFGLPFLAREALAPTVRVAEALALGVCAAGTAPTGIYLLAAQRRLPRPDVELLQFFSSVDDLPALALLGLVCVLLHPDTAAFGLPGALQWLGLSAGLGILLGMAAHWVFPKGEDVRHSSLVLLAVVAMGGGAAALLRLSPLFICALAGILFANLSPRKESAYGLLTQGEHSLYAVFLLLAGTLFRFQWPHLYLWIPAFVLLRGLAKWVGGWVGARVLLADSRVSANVGVGLLFQGGITLAIAVSLAHAYPRYLSHSVTTTVVLAVLVNELLAPLITTKVLADGKVR